MTNLEESLLRGGASRKIATGHKPDQSVVGKRNGAFSQNPKWSKAWR